MRRQTKLHRTGKTLFYHACVMLLGIVMVYPLLWMIMSSFKPTNTVFSTAGTLIPTTWTLDNYVNGLRGFGKVMPLTCAAFVVGAVALTGVPPLSGFVSKWNLLTAAADTGLALGTVAVVALIISAVLTAVYLFTAILPMYGRPLNAESAALEGFNRDPGWQMKLPFIVLMIAIVALGLWSTPLVTFLRNVAAGLIQ